MTVSCSVSWFSRHICGHPVTCNPFWPGGDHLGSSGSFLPCFPRIQCWLLSSEICSWLFFMLSCPFLHLCLWNLRLIICDAVFSKTFQSISYGILQFCRDYGNCNVLHLSFAFAKTSWNSDIHVAICIITPLNVCEHMLSYPMNIFKLLHCKSFVRDITVSCTPFVPQKKNKLW